MSICNLFVDDHYEKIFKQLIQQNEPLLSAESLWGDLTFSLRKKFETIGYAAFGHNELKGFVEYLVALLEKRGDFTLADMVEMEWNTGQKLHRQFYNNPTLQKQQQESMTVEEIKACLQKIKSFGESLEKIEIDRASFEEFVQMKEIERKKTRKGAKLNYVSFTPSKSDKR